MPLPGICPSMAEASLIPAIVEALGILVQNFHLVLIGTLVGMALGVVPGMGGSVTLALLIPFTIGMDPQEAFILYGSAWGSTTFAGSITAILVNTPGTASNAATLLDGFPLTRAGRAREAIGAAAASSATGAIMALAVFLITIPILREFALLFGSVEMLLLAIMGITVIPAAVRGSLIKGVIGGGLGFIFAFHGYSILGGSFRWPYVDELTGSAEITMIPLIIGVFAVSEMLMLGFEQSGIVDSEAGEVKGSLMKGITAPLRNKLLWFQSSFIGLIVGAIPGVGGSVASLLSYSFGAQNFDRNNDWGEGNIQGVIASEAANDAKDGGQLIPTFGLGIPGSGSAAVLLGAFLVHGFVPGPHFIREALNIVLLVLFALLASNILTSVIGILTAGILVKVTKIDLSYLFPTIIAFALFAAFVTRSSWADVVLTFVFGIIGFIFMLYNTTRVALVIAFVLAPLFEENLARTLQLGEMPGILFTSWVSTVLVLIILIALFQPVLSGLSRKYGILDT